MITTEQSCGKCNCYEGQGINQGICRESPPKVFMVPTASAMPGVGGIGWVSRYPPVESNDVGCGKFEEET